MANEQNLTHPPMFIDREKARECGRKGGLVKSDKKKWAARLRHLRKKGLTDENAKLISDMLQEKESFAMDTLMWLMSLKKECKSVGEKTNIARVLNDVCKLIHGEKLQTENTHHVINWSSILDNCVADDEKIQDK